MCFYSLSEKTYVHKISRSLEVARLERQTEVSLNFDRGRDSIITAT